VMKSNSFYTQFISKLIFPMHEKLKKHNTVSVFKEMEKSQWLNSEQLKQIQVKRLKQLIKYIITNVPYYRELFKQLNLSENDFNATSDLQKLPFLNKDIIRKNTEQLKSECAVGLSRFNTGGSSGEPLVFFIGKQRVSHDVAAKWRATRWWDVDIGDKEIVLWGSPIELGSQDYVRLFRDKIFRTTLLSAFELNQEKIGQFLQFIKTSKPAMLFGYPSVMALLADYAGKHQINMKNVGIKVAFVTSERLYDYQRTAIENTFNCPVANGYGGRDAGFIAHQCPEGSMHITAEDIIVEIVDKDDNVQPAGQSGEIVVTHLATSDFPFMRYRTGDVGVLSDKQCSCGRGLPVLEEIQGRTTDFIYAVDGTAMHGLALIYILREVEGVEQFKITQHDLYHIELQIVKNNYFQKCSEAIIKEQFKERLGSVNIEINYMVSIPVEASGKFRYITNKMNTTAIMS